MRKSLLISAALFLALTAAVYAAFPHAPAASPAAPVATAALLSPPVAPFAAAVCCTPSTGEARGEVTMVEVEMTPIVNQAPAQKSDERFAHYVLENAASGGQ